MSAERVLGHQLHCDLFVVPATYADMSVILNMPTATAPLAFPRL